MMAVARIQDVVKRFDFATHGFKRAGSTFYLDRGASVGLIDFQKGKSTKEELIFTVNLGVYVRPVAKLFHPADVKDRPDIWDCHWRIRLGYLLPEQGDKWWSSGSLVELDPSISEIDHGLTKYGVPELLRVLDPAELRNDWLDGRSPGLTDMQRLLNVSVLVQELGPPERLPMLIYELRSQSQGRPHEQVVENHIEKLGRR
jgi:hypothetical protein